MISNVNDVINNVKKAATVGYKLVKEKTGISENEIPSDILGYFEQYQDVKNKFNRFNSVLLSFEQTISELIDSNMKNMNELRRLNLIDEKILQSYEKYYKNIRDNHVEYFEKNFKRQTLDYLCEIQTRLLDCKALKKDLKYSIYYCNTLRNDMDRYTRKGKTNKVDETLKLLNQETEKLERTKVDFITKISNIYESRFYILNDSMRNFVSHSYMLVNSILNNAAVLNSEIQPYSYPNVNGMGGNSYVPPTGYPAGQPFYQQNPYPNGMPYNDPNQYMQGYNQYYQQNLYPNGTPYYDPNQYTQGYNQYYQQNMYYGQTQYPYN